MLSVRSVKQGIGRIAAPLASWRLLVVLFSCILLTSDCRAVQTASTDDVGPDTEASGAGELLPEPMPDPLSDPGDGAEATPEIVPPPIDERLLRLTVHENAPVGTVLKWFPPSDLVSTDPDMAYRFIVVDGPSDGAVHLDEQTGRLTVANSQAFDFESGILQRLTVSVQRASLPDTDMSLERQFLESVRDSGVAETEITPQLRQVARLTVEIHSIDINEKPVATDQVLQIAENSFRGTLIGTLQASDPDRGDRLKFEICDTDSVMPFEIDAQTGAVVVSDPARFNFEQAQGFDCRVKISDRSGAFQKIRLHVRVIDINEPPVLTAAGIATTVTLDAHSSTWRARLAAVDVDCEDSCVYQILTDPTNGGFAVDAVSGDLTVADVDKLRSFDGDGCELRVQAMDHSGCTSVCPITLTWIERSAATSDAVAGDVSATDSVANSTGSVPNDPLRSVMPLLAAGLSLMTGIATLLLVRARARAKRSGTSGNSRGQRRILRTLADKAAVPPAPAPRIPAVPTGTPFSGAPLAEAAPAAANAAAAALAAARATESQLVHQVKQLRDELQRNQSAATKLKAQHDAAVAELEQRIAQQQQEIRDLNEELRLVTARFDTAWSESETIEHLKLQIRQRNQLILEFKSRLQTLLHPAPIVEESPAPFYAACELAEPWEPSEQSLLDETLRSKDRRAEPPHEATQADDKSQEQSADDNVGTTVGVSSFAADDQHVTPHRTFSQTDQSAVEAVDHVLADDVRADYVQAEADRADHGRPEDDVERALMRIRAQLSGLTETAANEPGKPALADRMPLTDQNSDQPVDHATIRTPGSSMSQRPPQQNSPQPCPMKPYPLPSSQPSHGHDFIEELLGKYGCADADRR